MYQILFIDIDGTLLNNSNDICRENVIAIQKAQNIGIKICLATGRTHIASKKIIDIIHPDYLISSDGFFIFNLKKKKCLTTIFDFLYNCILMMFNLENKISKGTGVLKLCKLLDISTTNSICIGNDENDISMIKICDKGCCTKNAIPHLKEISDYICNCTNNESAVSEIINKFCL